MSEAKIVAVEDRHWGTHLVEQDGDELTVVDAEELTGFSQIQVGDEIRAFEAAGDVLTLDSALVGTYDVDERVYAYPRRVDRIAEVLEPGGAETLKVVIPHDFRDRVDLDTRGEVGERVELERVGGEMHVVQIHAEQPRIAGGFVDVPFDQFPAFWGLAELSAAWTPTADQVIVRPDVNSLALVTFSITFILDPDRRAEGSLMVNGVQVGPTPPASNMGGGGPCEVSVGAQCFVEMEAGGEYVLQMAGRGSASPGETIAGSKTGGLGYALFAG